MSKRKSPVVQLVERSPNKGKSRRFEPCLDSKRSLSLEDQCATALGTPYLQHIPSMVPDYFGIRIG